MDLKDAPSDMAMQLMLQSRLGVALLENLELTIGGEVARLLADVLASPRGLFGMRTGSSAFKGFPAKLLLP